MYTVRNKRLDGEMAFLFAGAMEGKGVSQPRPSIPDNIELSDRLRGPQDQYPVTALEITSGPQTDSTAWMLVPITEHSQWDRLIAPFTDYNYRQSWTYELESAARHNAQVERVAIKVGNEVIGLAVVRLKTVPFLKTGLAYAGGGPMTCRGRSDDLASLATCLTALRDEYLVRRGYTLRVLPPPHPALPNEAVRDCFASCGFLDSPWPPPYRTLMVDLNRTLPEIRKALHQKWRNCLNNSERQNLTIRSGNGPELFDQFHELFDKFLLRKNFSVDVGADFYRDIRARATTDEGFVVSLALADGVPVAGHLSSMLGDTGVSLLAGTTDDGLKNKSAYLLQWNMIVTAHQRGLRWYDLGGIDPEANPGVYHFKEGLRGQKFSAPGPFQTAPGGMRATAMSAAEKLYRWTKRYS